MSRDVVDVETESSEFKTAQRLEIQKQVQIV